MPGAAEIESRRVRAGAAEIDVGAIDGAREADGVCGRVEGVAGGRISHPNNADRIADSEGSV